MERLESRDNVACGEGPVVAVMKAARALGADRATVLTYGDSGDVTALPPEKVERGTRAEILGRHVTIDEAAAWAGTISYELLTRLGSRYARLYTGLESDGSA